MAVHYAGTFAVDDRFKLMELPAELGSRYIPGSPMSDTDQLSGLASVGRPQLEAEIIAGGQVCFKAEEAESAVLCSPTATYAVKVASTSNTLYFTDIEPGEDNEYRFGLGGDDGCAAVVEGSTTAVLELARCAPRVAQLAQILQARPFAGELANSAEDCADLPGAPWAELEAVVQASPAELSAGLAELHAFELQGRWQVLDESYAVEKFALILTTATAEGWSFDDLDVITMTEALEGHDTPKVAVQALLQRYGEPVAGKSDRFALVPERVCRFEATKLLQLNPRWPLEDFKAAWREAVPDGMDVDADHLRGLALVYNTGAEHSGSEVMYYPASALSGDIKKRMAELFGFRKEWTAEDITPYLVDVATGGLTVDKILFKHARAFTGPSGNRMYNAR